MPDHPEYLAPASAVINDEVGPFKPSPPLLPGSGGERAVILVAVLLQIAVLAAMITRNTVPYIGGQTVLLRVMPVDPRDLMRGDYVTLSYDISRMSPAMTRGMGRDDTSNRKAYVSLRLNPMVDTLEGPPRASPDPRPGPISRGRSRAGGGSTSASSLTTCKKARGTITSKPFESGGSPPRSSLAVTACQACCGLVIE